MLLEYMWCDKINVNSKNSPENAPVRKYLCFVYLPNASSCFSLTVRTGSGFLVYGLLIGFSVRCDMLRMSWMSWYMGLTSPLCCSSMSCLWWWQVWINNCSYGNSNVGLLMCFNRVIVSVIVPYSCLLLSMCRAYADCGSLCFM